MVMKLHSLFIRQHPIPVNLFFFCIPFIPFHVDGTSFEIFHHFFGGEGGHDLAADGVALHAQLISKSGGQNARGNGDERDALHADCEDR
mgnify:CR=1 FL=1